MNGEILGGAEKQIALIIQGLKSKGMNISVMEYELISPINIKGINFYPAWGKNKSTFLGKLLSLVKQIKENDIQVVYVRATQLYAACLFFYLRLTNSKIKLYWGVAGDHNLTSKLNYLRVNQATTWYGKIHNGYLFNLSSMLLFAFSNKVICQTQEQMERCKSIYKRKSVLIISNIYSIGESVNSESVGVIADGIWIGKFAGIKGEEVLLKMAQDFPQLKIVCLGNVSKEYENSLTFKKIKEQDNLILVGRVGNEKVAGYISKVNFVLNTSPSEGLSNVFLEGWSQEKPIISFRVDPNKYLKNGKAGFCAENNYDRLVDIVQKIQEDKQVLVIFGKNGKEILIKNHFPETILPKYFNLFCENPLL